MPAKSEKQKRAVAIALNTPEKLYKRNKSLAKMTRKQKTDYVTTPPDRIPAMAGTKKRPKRKAAVNKKSHPALPVAKDYPMGDLPIKTISRQKRLTSSKK